MRRGGRPRNLFASFVSLYLFTASVFFDWIIIGSLGGLFTGLALWRRDAIVEWKQLLMVSGGWAFAYLITGIPARFGRLRQAPPHS